MPDNEVLKSLFDEFNPKHKFARDYNEFRAVMSNENNRKDFFNEFNSKLNLAKDYNQFDEVLGLKKKEPTTKDFQSGSPISTKPFDVFQTESNKKNTFNAITGEVKPYVEPKDDKAKFDFKAIKPINPYAGKTTEEIRRLPIDDVVSAEREKEAKVQDLKKSEKTYFNQKKSELVDYYKSKAKRDGSEGTYLNLPTQFVSSVGNFLFEPAKGIVSAARDISSSLSETTGQGKLPDISNPNYKPSLDDLSGLLIRGLDYSNAYFEAQKEAYTLPDDLGGKTVRGITDALPLIGSMAVGNVGGVASEISNAIPTVGKIVQNSLLNPLTKQLVKQNAASAYGKSRSAGESVSESLKKAGEAGAEGFKSGTELAAMGGLAGRLTPKILGSLAEKGLVFGTGAATEKLTHALIMGASGGGLSAAKDVLSGNEVDWDKAIEQSALFLAFEIAPVSKSILGEVVEPIRSGRIDRSVVDNAKNAVKTEDVLNINAARNFLNTDNNAIQIANKVKESHQDLQYKSLEEGMKALDAKTSEEKATYFINQDRLQKISDIKYVTEAVLRDRDGVVKSIEQMDIPDNLKQQYIKKVNDVYENNHPDEVDKQALAGEVQIKKDAVSDLDETINNSKDPIKTTKAELEKEKLETEIKEYAAMENPKDKAEKQKIYDKYDKLITPLLEQGKTEAVKVEEVKLPEFKDDSLDLAIEVANDITELKQKQSRAKSKASKEMLAKKIAESELELQDIPVEAKIAKGINDNFDKIKKELKDKNLIEIKGC